MRLLFLSFFLVSCAQINSKPKAPQDEVTVKTALDQAQMSYLRGCVEAHKNLKRGPSFEICRDRAIAHRIELESIMNAPIEGVKADENI